MRAGTFMGRHLLHHTSSLPPLREVFGDPGRTKRVTDQRAIPQAPRWRRCVDAVEGAEVLHRRRAPASCLSLPSVRPRTEVVC